MDDFRFYNRALTTTEMTTIYNYVKTVNYTATVSNGSFYLKKFTGRAILNPTITFRPGFTYTFDQSDSTNANNQIVFSRSTTGNPPLTTTNVITITTNGTPGTSGANTKLDLSSSFTGNLYYLPSPTTTSPTTTNPTITNFTIPTKQYGDAAFTLTAPTSDSSGAFTYTSANTSVATISGNTVTILSAGSTVITATQAATSTYNSGTISATLTVSNSNTNNNTNNPFICFLKGSKITCLNDETGEEQEVEIENISLGTFVKTYLHGYVPVSILGTKIIYNPGHDTRTKDRLYTCSKKYYPALTEDLIITGCHSILVDELTEEQNAKTLEDTMDIFITDDKYRLMCFLDPRAEPYMNEGTFSIYHITLEHTDSMMNYGIYANGLLVESCSKRSMQEKSYMKLISTA
jgi:hypothetical protein